MEGSCFERRQIMRAHSVAGAFARVLIQLVLLFNMPLAAAQVRQSAEVSSSDRLIVNWQEHASGDRALGQVAQSAVSDAHSFSDDDRALWAG